ncbi:MAG: hypothetical protein A3F84_28395 [Candidatus Handelsmanbacteria bacterium RIFCSPLOWO2_12_FULL_64_10]|uniref:Sensory/regulatory protein RpfC n=1 Tax=Handelsmanbacteria sp. (strain RIFCSPLOWO2_12_FULL_64_10) TaxID=1817868 RepID=A0A1F6CCJ6_HANXR|nr:MAG: hypothetical protein A3F84_28395 [Candidatus Handelsmanbacteria bacterium RIFCSPLOWO2_12_FULL_64_10]
MNAPKILIVDDTPANVKALRMRLSPEGYEVLEASDGLQALERVAQEKPDLVLLDVMMPGLNGFEVCRRVKSQPDTQFIPVVLVTALTDRESKVTGIEAGADDFINKPLDPDELRARVKSLLRTKSLHDELQRGYEELRRLTEDLKAANRQVQEATRRKSQFLANMSHELRTPMNAILGFTDLVLRRSGDALPDQQRDNLMKVKLSADHLLNLINDLLDLSKIEAGRVDIISASFHVKRLIANCCATVSPLVKPGVTLNYEVADDVGEAHTDEARLRQIIINLLSNALKFTEQGEVKVRVARPPTADRRPPPSIPGPPSSVVGRPSEDGFLEIAVSDTGIGIPPEALGYIFEEFRQVEGSPQQQKGTGLGLSITKKLTELLGGTIEVTSEVGRGSKFTVRIPAVYQAPVV